MTTPDAAREIDREWLAKVVAACVSVPAWSGMSEPRRMACRQAGDSILADLTAQGYVVVPREDFRVALRSYAYTVDRTAHPPEDHDRVKRLRAALTAAPEPSGEPTS